MPANKSNKLTKVQEAFLKSLKCDLLTEEWRERLRFSGAPKENEGILDTACSDVTFAECKDHALNTYVVHDRKGVIYFFFSLRSGEIFMNMNPERLLIANNAWEALRKLYKEEGPNGKMDARLRSLLLDDIIKAYNAGLNLEDFILEDESPNIRFKVDKLQGEDVTQTLRSHPAVELKLFSKVNTGQEKFKKLFDKRGIGEVVFWYFIIPIIQKARESIGIEYLYLFAESLKGERLVEYYQHKILMIPDLSEQTLSCCKPMFDLSCRFMYQKLDVLIKHRKQFLATINKPKDERMLKR